MSADGARRAGFLRAFLASVLGTGLSRVLGAVRDIVIARVLGASGASDAFWIAFTTPNTLRRFVADEGLTGALVPAIARAEAEDSEQAAKVLANRVLTALLAVNVALCVAGWFGAEWLVKAFAYKFVEDPAKFQLTVELTRGLMPFVAMISMVSFCEGLLNHRGHFFVPKLAPGLVSAGIVASAVLLIDEFEHPTYALVVGVLVGGVAHVLVNLPVLFRLWGPLRIDFHVLGARVRRVLWELSKVVAIGVFAQINILVLRQLAALVGEGGITHYWYANRMVDLSQGIIAIAIGSALLPGVSSAVADKDWERLQKDIVGALRLTGFLLLPVALGLLVFAEPLTAILFRHGAWTWADTVTTAQTLRLLVPFMLAVAGINVLKKVYFALDDRNTLLWVGLVGVGVTAVLGWVLVDMLGVAGLALALSVSTVVQLGVYVLVLYRHIGEHLGLSLVIRPLVRMAVAGIPLAVVLAGTAALGEWQRGPASVRNIGLLIGGGGLGVLAWQLAARQLGIAEFDETAGRVLRRFRRR